MREGPSLFTTPEEQIARLRSWNREWKWGYTDDDFARVSDMQPILGAQVADTVLTLVPYPVDREVYHVDRRKAAEAQTNRGSDLWRIAARPFARHDAWPTLNGGECWTIGRHPFHTGLRWEAMRLRTLPSAADVREILSLKDPPRSYEPPHAEETLPHLGVIAALALHPIWVATMAADPNAGVLVPGYGFYLPVHQLASTRKWNFLLVRPGGARDRLTARLVQLPDRYLQPPSVVPELVEL